jgi:short-subunit dehydrogenase
MSSKSIVIIGATSAIAHGVAKLYAKDKARFALVARNAQNLDVIANDLRSRGASHASTFIADLKDIARHDEIVRFAMSDLGRVDIVILAHGLLKDQTEIDNDVDATLEIFEVNATSMISLAHRFGCALEKQGSGTLVGLSSVAGERGRRAIYAYGAAKSAVSEFLSGMRGRYLPLGINVLTVKPGPVDTPMTAGRTLPLLANVDKVSLDIRKAIDTRKHVLYTPGIWRVVMAIMRSIPEGIFQRMKI